MEKRLYRLHFFGYHVDEYGTEEHVREKALYLLSRMPYRYWYSKGCTIERLGLDGRQGFIGRIEYAGDEIA